MTLFTHILALATVALVALSSLPANANVLAPDHAQAARHIRAHDAVAKRRRDASSTCIPRPSTALPTPTPAPTPTPSATPSSTAVPLQNATFSGSSSKKMGLAWAEDDQYLGNFKRPKVGFFHNWSAYMPPQLKQFDIEGIPLLWGPSDVAEFQRLVVKGYANYAGAFNEPDQPSQANMLPQDAANLWVEYMNPLKDLGYTLHSACCTDSPDAKTWYLEFFGNCTERGCHIDLTCVHFYNTDVNYIIDYAHWLYETFGLPVIATEVGDQDFSGANQQPTSVGQVMAFAQALVDFAETTEWMFAAFPYGIMDNLNINQYNALIDPNTHEPTPLAYTYFG